MARQALVVWVAAGLLFHALPAFSGDWGQFRGPAGTGVSQETGVPLIWAPDHNVKWRAPLPAPGNSSPVVSRDRVFVTVASDEGRQRHLYCFTRAEGRQLWVRSVAFSGEEPTHSTNPHCSSSPATDGQRVVVWHASAGLYCYDYEGQLLWERDLGKFIHVWGSAASPIIYRDSVILNCGPGERTFVIAIDKQTGKTLWQTDEPGGTSGLVKKNPTDERAPWIGSWSTPVVAQVDGQDQILVSMPHHVRAYSPVTGEILWSCAGLGDLVYSSVVWADGLGVAMSGFHGPAIGFRLGGSGDVTATHRLWQVAGPNPQRIGSGVILGEYLYVANEPGIVQCLHVKTGAELWRARLPGSNVWGSIVAADGRLYVTDQKGDTLVWRPNPQKLEILAINSLGEPSNSTPAFSDAQIFIRTFNALSCIEEE